MNANQIVLDFSPKNLIHADLARPANALRPAILDYCRAIAAGRTPASRSFHMADLLAAVEQRVARLAPDSVSRILRDLRSQGVLSYRCIDKAKSLYEIEWVKEKV